MSQILLGREAIASLEQASEVVEVRDETGRLVGHFRPISLDEAPARSPYPKEEIERRRQQRSGRPLADILKDLAAGE